MANDGLTLNPGSGGVDLGSAKITDPTLGVIYREENIAYGGENIGATDFTADTASQTLIAAPGVATQRLVVTGLDICLQGNASQDVSIVITFDTGSTIFKHPGVKAGAYIHKGGYAFGFGPLNKALQVTPTGLAASGATLSITPSYYIEDFA